jgi:hypothetical protein
MQAKKYGNPNKPNKPKQYLFLHRTDINRIKSNQIILLNMYPNPSIKEEETFNMHMNLG